MWSPTHIQVTVQRAKDLLTKGKNGTNNCFVTIALGKEKYQTSVKEKAEANVSWNEECELKIPDQGNRAELILTCLHRNNLGIDEFLGQATLPLNEMDVYDRPRSKFFKLQSKPGKEKKNKERGELEVRISFVVKSGSLTDLSKKEKHKSSVGQLASSVGGSLLSLGAIEKRKGIKKFAKSLGSKMHLHSKKKNKDGDDLSFTGSFASIDQANAGGGLSRYGQRAGEADPGVISEDEDEFVFDNLSHKSSGSSLNVRNSSGGGLQVPPLKNHAPRVPSPLLDQQATAAYKGNDIEEESESEKFVENYNIQSTPSYNKEQTNIIEEEQNKLPPPSQQEKHSPLANDWDLKPYTTQKFESSTNQRLSFSALSEAKLEGEAPKEEVQTKTIAEPPKEQLKTANSFSKLEAAVVPEISDLVEEVPKLRSQENSKKKLKNDEWESKLYLDINKSDSLKRNTWQTARVQLPITDLESPKTESQRFSLLFENDKKGDESKNDREDSDSDSSSTEDDDDHEEDPDVVAAFVQSKNENNEVVKKIANNINDQFIANEAGKVEEQEQMPKPSPRYYPKLAEAAKLEETTIKLNPAYEAKKLEQANMLDNIKLNLGYERQAANKENNDVDGEDELQNAKLRERSEEDRRILNFINDSKMRESLDRKSNGNGDLNSSPKEREQREKRFGKLKNLNEGGKQASPRFNERIIIGHEKSHAERRSEMTEALAKKYDGKSREELMLIANGMENEVLIYRQRVKELEDYLDNLLLRVMETHPKILQNPYSRTKSTKSG